MNIYICKGMSLKRLKFYCKNVDLTEIEFSILKDFYVKRKNVTELAYKYNYSERSIFYIKEKAINKIHLVKDGK